MNENFAVGKIITYTGSIEILCSGIESIGQAELIANFLMGKEKYDTIIIIPGYNTHLSNGRIMRAKELIRTHKRHLITLAEQRKKQRLKIGPKPKRIQPNNYQNNDYIKFFH